MNTLEPDTQTRINMSLALRSLEVRANIAIGFLAVSVAYWLAEAYAGFSRTLSDGFIDFIVAAETFYPILVLATGVAFIAWSYKAHANLELIGRTGIHHDDQATIWWWVVPIANLFMPFKVMYETVRGSKAPADSTTWRTYPVGAAPIWWTATLIAGMITTRVASSMLFEATTYEELDMIFKVGGAGAIAMAIAGATAISMIDQVRADQRRLAA